MLWWVGAARSREPCGLLYRDGGVIPASTRAMAGAVARARGHRVVNGVARGSWPAVGSLGHLHVDHNEHWLDRALAAPWSTPTAIARVPTRIGSPRRYIQSMGSETPPAATLNEMNEGEGDGDAAIGWEDLPEILTVPEAAAFLRMKPATVYESVRAGLIPAARPSPRCIRLSKTELRHWLQGKRSA